MSGFLEIDAGGSHNPKNILNFIKFINNDYDCIYGSRFCKNGKMLNSNYIRDLFSKGGSLLTNFFNINLWILLAAIKCLTKCSQKNY